MAVLSPSEELQKLYEKRQQIMFGEKRTEVGQGDKSVKFRDYATDLDAINKRIDQLEVQLGIRKVARPFRVRG